MSSFNESLHRLTGFRILAQKYQDKTGTTVKQPPEKSVNLGLHTVRETISLVLIDHDIDNRRFALFREPVPGHDLSSTHRRLAVFGGGMRSKQEDAISKAASRDPDPLFPELVDKEGNLRADAYYQLLGKGLLRTGRLPEITFNTGTRNMRRNLNFSLVSRLQTEIGDFATRITNPVYLRNMEPRETHVMGRTVGDYTKQCAEKYNFLLNKKNQLADLCITVRERFAWAFADINVLARGNADIRIFDLEEFVDFLAPQITDSVDDWIIRSDVREDSIRNDSTIFAVAESLEHTDSGIARAKKQIIDWLKQVRGKPVNATAL